MFESPKKEFRKEVGKSGQPGPPMPPKRKKMGGTVGNQLSALRERQHERRTL